MAYNFENKVVLVTGSSSGIGAATAVHFSSLGAKVVVTGRNADNVRKVAAQCEEASPKKLKALQVVADVTVEADVQRLLQSTIDTFGQLDILVNNAGTGAGGQITDADAVDKYDRIMNLDVRSVFYLTHLAVPHLEKTKGNIVNVSSVAGLKPSAHVTVYCMAKAALDMFTKCLALELGPKGIRVNSVNPAVVKTNILSAVGVDKESAEKYYKYMASQYPIGRVGESEDIANAIAYLASSDASFITGVTLVADGGAINANIARPPSLR